MYCTECGIKNYEDSIYCMSCGHNIGQKSEESLINPKLESAENKYKLKDSKSNRAKDNKTFWKINLIAVTVILFFIGMKGIQSFGVQSTPENVVRSMYKVIEKSDVDLFFKIVSPSKIINMKEYYGSIAEMKQVAKIDFDYLSKEAENMYGKNWSSKVRIFEKENVAPGVFEVKSGIANEATWITVHKIGRKYYIDYDDFF